MSLSLSITQDQSLTILRTFLLSILPTDVEVVLSQDNRVPEPEVDNFITMTPLSKERIEWNTTTYSDLYPSGLSTRTDLAPTKFGVQLDVHGSASADNIQIISTLFFSDYAYDQFATASYDVKPLYCSEPHQMPFINGEQQYENRWVIDLYMQVNSAIVSTQQFADEIVVDIISVDATYPII